MHIIVRKDVYNMAYDLIPPVQAVINTFPEKKNDTFDRIMEVANFIKGGAVGSVCHTIDSAFQTYALMQGRRDTRKMVKYVTHMEEVKALANVEMRKIDLQEQKTKMQHDVLKLYVDKQYQATVDKITTQFHIQSYNIESERQQAIYEIDKYSKHVMNGINTRYQRIIREQEAVCAAYRDFLYGLSRQGRNKAEVAHDIIIQLISHAKNLSDERFRLLSDIVAKMIEPDFISFEDFVSLRTKGLRRLK